MTRVTDAMRKAFSEEGAIKAEGLLNPEELAEEMADDILDALKKVKRKKKDKGQN